MDKNQLISPLLRAFLLLPILGASLDGCADLHEAEWVDQQAMVAGNLVSSRSPGVALGVSFPARGTVHLSGCVA